MEEITNTFTPVDPLGQWEQADFALANGLGRVLFYGAPGTGKTFYAMNYHLNGKPSYRLICNDEMTESHILCMWKPTLNDNGQFDDTTSPSVRMLDDKTVDAPEAPKKENE